MAYPLYTSRSYKLQIKPLASEMPQRNKPQQILLFQRKNKNLSLTKKKQKSSIDITNEQSQRA